MFKASEEFFAKQKVSASRWTRDAGGDRHQVGFARSQKSSHSPEISNVNRPIHAFQDRLRRPFQWDHAHLPHFQGGNPVRNSSHLRNKVNDNEESFEDYSENDNRDH